MTGFWERLTKSLSTYDLAAMGAGFFRIAVIIVISRILVAISWRIIESALIDEKKGNYFLEERKARTLGLLLKSVVRYTIYAIAAVTVLGELGIKTSALLAGAGVLGLAVGFGAQHLVKDVITGFFILFEDQYSVGDFIKTPDAAGVVEEIGLRITKLRDINGGLHIIPNSEIRTLTNFNRGHAQAVVDIEVAYHEDTEKVAEILKEIALQMAKDWNGIILKEPDVLGVTQLGQSGISFRVLAQTLPMEHWKVERELRKRVKDIFDQKGIEIPYPHHVIIDGKGGK